MVLDLVLFAMYLIGGNGYERDTSAGLHRFTMVALTTCLGLALIFAFFGDVDTIWFAKYSLAAASAWYSFDIGRDMARRGSLSGNMLIAIAKLVGDAGHLMPILAF
jgi:hypothetical protein